LCHRRVAPSPDHCALPLFFQATATTELYTLSLHDALPISDDFGLFVGIEIGGRLVQDEDGRIVNQSLPEADALPVTVRERTDVLDRKSTRLNSSHVKISYAVFCLKKKKRNLTSRPRPRLHG